MPTSSHNTTAVPTAIASKAHRALANTTSYFPIIVSGVAETLFTLEPTHRRRCQATRGLLYRPQMRGCGIAEDKGPLGAYRQRRSRPELRQIDKIEQYLYLSRRHAPLAHDSVSYGVTHTQEAQNSWKRLRSLVTPPWQTRTAGTPGNCNSAVMISW